MTQLSKSAQRCKAYEDGQIARAVRFTAHLHIGPGETHKHECATMSEAFAMAEQLNLLSEYGRKAIVYAITPEGFSFLVEENI